MKSMTFAAILASVVLTACNTAPSSKTEAQTSPATTVNGMLVGPNQMTLYIFERDTAGSGQSVCNGPCATNWPPLIAPAGAQPIGGWSVVKRDDGSSQWAYKGRPLYFWSKDVKPGDATGDSVANAWRIARP